MLWRSLPVLFFCWSAWAQVDSCLPSFTSLQAFHSLNMSQPVTFRYALKDINQNGFFTTHNVLNATFDGNRTLNLRVQFDEGFTGISLPYNLYAVLVLLNGRVVAWHDFTKSCREPGIGFFPGQSYLLPPVDLKALGIADLQIVIWGRL